jgi:hypothetical protein
MVFEASLNFDPQQEQVVITVGVVLCAVVLVLLTRRQIAAVAPGERWESSRGRVLASVLLAAYWTVVGAQLWIIVR